MTLSLSTIPNDLAVDVLKKMNLVALTRARKTSSILNTLIETNSNVLKKNNHLVDLKIEIHSNFNGWREMVSKVVFDEAETVLTNPVAQLSAVNAMRVTFTFLNPYHSRDEEIVVLPELKEMLLNIRISPKILFFQEVGHLLAEGVLSALGAPRTVVLNYPTKWFNFQEFGQLPIESKEVMVAKMNAANYEEMRDFSFFQLVNVDIELINEFVKISFFDFSIPRLRRTEFFLSHGRPLTFLNGFPEDNVPPFRSFAHVVHVLESENKWIIARKMRDCFIVISLCEKTSQALWTTLVDLVHEETRKNADISEYRRDFCDAISFKEQSDVFRNFCFNMCRLRK